MWSTTHHHHHTSIKQYINNFNVARIYYLLRENERESLFWWPVFIIWTHKKHTFKPSLSAENCLNYSYQSTASSSHRNLILTLIAKLVFSNYFSFYSLFTPFSRFSFTFKYYYLVIAFNSFNFPRSLTQALCDAPSAIYYRCQTALSYACSKTRGSLRKTHFDNEIELKYSKLCTEVEEIWESIDYGYICSFSMDLLTAATAL